MDNLVELFAQPADVALFYFSGHGYKDDVDGYLVTEDASTHTAGVSMTELLTFVNNSDVKEAVIILDSCHSGAAGAIPIIDEKKVFLKEGTSILTASRASENAMEVDNSGIFTSLICDALKGGGKDVLGRVTVAGVYAYADQTLGAWQQRPLFKSFISKLVPLRICKPQIDLPILRLLSTYFPDADYEFQLDPSYEPEAEPDDAEHEKIFGHLQKYRASHLLVPVGEEHMYFAAINNKSCILTELGKFYWYLAKNNKL
jgi:hypothetical protein